MKHRRRHRFGGPYRDLRVQSRRVVLVGNPNVGKSVFFGHFTGTYAEVSNYPGTTVELSRGSSKHGTVIDTPGVYGVSSFTDEERVARDIILQADVVVNVVDAVHLDRDLFLTLQIADMGIPMIVALNFMDEAEREGIKVDVARLSDLLGVPVVPTVATRGIGLAELDDSIERARPGIPAPAISEHLSSLLSAGIPRAEAILILEGDEAVAQRNGAEPAHSREQMYIERRQRVDNIVAATVTEVRTGRRLSAWLGTMALHPVAGTLILGGVLYGLYELIGVLFAQVIVGFTEGTVMQGYWEPLVRHLMSRMLATDSVAGSILIGEFGVLTMTVTYLIGLLLPLVLGFYLALSVLEDSGYLPRLAALADRLLTGIGLNGRAVIPIILGFGCITMATITTRVLGTRRERSIASSILNLAIPCSAQLGVIAMLLARVGPGYAVAYVGIIFSCLVIVGTVLNRFLPGKSSPLLLALPPLRLPDPTNILRKTIIRSLSFMREATPWFILGSLVVSFMQVTGLLGVLQTALSPLTVAWLQLPREAAVAFVLGMVRRDFGAAGFTDMSLSPAQTLVALTTITLFVPCVASVMVLFKERGRLEATLIWMGTLITAFCVGGLVATVVI